MPASVTILSPLVGYSTFHLEGLQITRMTLHRAFYLVSWFLILLAAGCRGDTGTSRTDSISSASASVVPTLPVPVNTGWQEDEAGPALLLSDSASASTALVVFPSLTDSVVAGTKAFNADSLTGMSFDLFGRPGSAGPAILTAESRSSSSEGCVSWPAGTLAGNIQRTWRFGLKRGLATAIPLDSLEGMTSVDSVQVTTELARLASSLTVTSDPAFEGLPFSVRKAYRGTLGKKVMLIGDVVRKINEEANPREEHLLLIAERELANDVPYTAVFQSRAAGSEEIVRTSEILGALKFLNGRPVIVVSFNYENGGRVALIERVSDSGWKLTWRSAYTGC
jgi:hypothetical protein